MKKDNHELLKRWGRYAVIRRQTQYADEPKFVVCCGYCDKTGEWGQGYYFKDFENALVDYAERITNCRLCPHRHRENHPTWCLK